MYKYLLTALIGAAIIFSPILAFGQEEEEGYGDYSSGTVVKVDAVKREIVINEYDYAADSDKPVTYSIAPEAVLENVNSLKEISPNMYADIEYSVDKTGKKIATSISVYPSEYE